ncbi:MAG: uroporphyrinogen decarboxylase family protein [Candidatus Acetothermia bacterium]
MPFGTLEVVRKDVKDKIEAFAPGGGYVFSTIHNIQPEVPPENVMAMLETLREFGAY